MLAALDWPGAAIAVALVFVIRPLATLVGFRWSGAPVMSRHLMGFFGTRGIGTFFYLQYAFNRADFPQRHAIWAVAGAAILLSIVVHGVTATPLMAKADERRERRLAQESRG